MNGDNDAIARVLDVLEIRESEALERVRACERSIARHMERRVKLAGALPPVAVLPAHDIAKGAVELAEAMAAYRAVRMAVDDVLRMQRGSDHG